MIGKSDFLKVFSTMARFVMLSLLTSILTALLHIGKLSNRPNLSKLVFDMMIDRGNNHKTKNDRSSLVLNFDHGNGIIIEPQLRQPSRPGPRLGPARPMPYSCVPGGGTRIIF